MPGCIDVDQDAHPRFVVDFPRWAAEAGAEYVRKLALPTTVESARAKASLKDGVLELTLPKVEKSKRRTTTVD